ncbi:MAG: CPBP family intramembrane metalloprotease [bacterium]|nr:MAG: CPBP family intramembrane metalloprotease [bacterium]
MTKQLITILNPKGLCYREQIKPTLLLLLSAILPTIHIYFGSIDFARNTFPSISGFGASNYMFISMFVLMGLLPVAIVLFLFKDSLRDYGLTIGDWRKGFPLTTFLVIIIAGLMLYPSSQTADFRNIYPLDKSAGETLFNFIRFEILRGLFFYTAWEFFFRGFMLFGLRKFVGEWIAICVQTIPSCLWHIGLPTGEIFASIVAGILFGIIAVRTNSILWVLILHFLIGLFLDLFIVIT